MDYGFFCSVCAKACGNIMNYDAHMRGKEHQRKLAGYMSTTAAPAEQIFMEGDFDEDDDDYELMARPSHLSQPPLPQQPTLAVRRPLHEAARPASQSSIWPPACVPQPSPTPQQPSQRPTPPIQRPTTLQPQQPTPQQPSLQRPTPTPQQPSPTTQQPTAQPSTSQRRWETVSNSYCQRPAVSLPTPAPPSPASPVVMSSPPRRVNNPQRWVNPIPRPVPVRRSPAAPRKAAQESRVVKTPHRHYPCDL